MAISADLLADLTVPPTIFVWTGFGDPVWSGSIDEFAQRNQLSATELIVKLLVAQAWEDKEPQAVRIPLVDCDVLVTLRPRFLPET